MTTLDSELQKSIKEVMYEGLIAQKMIQPMQKAQKMLQLVQTVVDENYSLCDGGTMVCSVTVSFIVTFTIHDRYDLQTNFNHITEQV